MPDRSESDVCIIVEGAYPFVVGGVSSWLQDLIQSLPDVRFSVLAIKALDTPEAWRLAPPANVVEVVEVPLAFEPRRPRRYPAAALERIAAQLIAFILSGDRERFASLIAEFRQLRPAPAAGDILASPAIFHALSQHYRATCPASSFHHFFWATRVLLGGLIAILLAPLPRARTYHALSTGYAGLVAARAACETGRQVVLTEHGIYQLERHIEVMMAEWIGDQVDGGLVLRRDFTDLRDLWLSAFRSYARACYDACDPIIALYAANNATQELLGAERRRLRVIPNGVDPGRFLDIGCQRDPGRPLIALLGRVVPIKDVKTFVTAAALVHAELPDARFVVLGPLDEDPAYAAECVALVAELGLEPVFAFAGRVNIAEWMPRIDVLVLTSLSEAQPLVILEAGACGIPVVAPDVGSCREMIEGRGGDDPGDGGLVTPLVNPEATASAIVRLARDPRLRRTMGETLRKRVIRHYNYARIVAQYREIYDVAATTGRSSSSQLSSPRSRAGASPTMAASMAADVAGAAGEQHRTAPRPCPASPLPLR